MQPLVLAIEPDLRQAAIVKRIVREKVLAEVNVVDSRDAALEAMRTTVPDVLLLSALLSPRDEDELIAHLRTLEHAEHLQTHTIPQLASSIASGEAKPSKGLLSAFRRRKGAESIPSGCDPDLFADEIRAYLQRASEKKREVRDAASMPAVARAATAARTVEQAARPQDTATETVGSSWSSPFEWRPTGSSSRVSAPEPAVAEPPARPAFTAPPMTAFAERAPEIADPQAATPSFEAPAAETASEIITREPVIEMREPAIPVLEPAIAVREPAIAVPEAVLEVPEPAFVVPAVVAARLPHGPVVLRRANEWWYVETRSYADTRDVAARPDDVLATLAVPASIAAVGYANGCRVRRVRLTPAA